ncbi:MAG TPA: histidine--tRNA ligase [Bacteroidia bacterium]|nr:histidine--tRNA ligase [Bacteroidia bacterium]
MANKPSIPKGTRDFSPEEMVKRNFIFDTIRSVFKKYGYQQIETPAMENLETLMGKYGEEGDKLIFKIRSNKSLRAKLGEEKSKKLDEIYPYWIPQNSDKALRYDLTVPFARFVVQHQSKLFFPFKRYQIQPVWRGDNPQFGRYREFFQCDADVIGSKSLLNEIELVQMIDEVFTDLKVPVVVKINNRKILAGIAEAIGAPDKMIDIAIAIDKYDKIGGDGVKDELGQKGLSVDQIRDLYEIILAANNRVIFGGEAQKGDLNLNKLNFLASGSNVRSNEILQKGIEESKFLFDTLKGLGLQNVLLEFDLTLARGLNYYTGAIFEVKVDRTQCKSEFTSSICGGGRYDDLTGIFGLPNVSGVGISFGIDRIFDVLNEVGYPVDMSAAGTRLLFINKGGKSESISLQLLKKIREQNIAAEIYPDNVKWEKQAKYVDAKKIPFTATVDENTYDTDQKIALKFQENGKWNALSLTIDELINKISA